MIQKEKSLRVTIAGYGSIGRYVEKVLEQVCDTSLYDPPMGLGSEEDLRDCDFVFICVPTPSTSEGACDVGLVEQVVNLASPRVAVVCHSTVAIGTTERLIRESGKPIVFVPEFAGESGIHPYSNPANRSFFIVGGHEPQAPLVVDLLKSAYGSEKIYRVVEPTVAEMVKYMSNTFLATKVAFCNEFHDLAKLAGVDYEELRALWLLDQRVSTSHTIVTPERGFGGKCLPKDLAAVCVTAREFGSPMGLLEAVEQANNRHRSLASTRLTEARLT